MAERCRVPAQKMFGVTMNKGCVAKIKDEERFSNWAWLPTLTVCRQMSIPLYDPPTDVSFFPSLGSNQPCLLNQVGHFNSTQVTDLHITYPAHGTTIC